MVGMWPSTHDTPGTCWRIGNLSSIGCPNRSLLHPQNRARTLRMIRYVCGRMYGETDFCCRSRTAAAPFGVTLNTRLPYPNRARNVDLIWFQKLTIENSSALMIDPNPL